MSGYRIVFNWHKKDSDKTWVGRDVFPTVHEAIEQLALTEDWESLEHTFKDSEGVEFSITIRPNTP